MSRRSYSGPALDGTVQYITERPELDKDADNEDGEREAASETVYATSPEPQGEETAENVPVPDEPDRPPELSGQTTLRDWRGEQA